MVGSGEWVRGVLVAAALLSASGNGARAEDGAAASPPDIVGDLQHMFSWIDDRLTEAIRAGQQNSEPAPPREEAKPAPQPVPAPPPAVKPAPENPAPVASAAPAEDQPSLSDLLNWLDAQLEAGASASHSAAPTAAPPEKPAAESVAQPPQAAAQPQPPQAAPTPVPAAPVVTAEPLDLTGKAQTPSNAGGRGGLLVR